MMLQQALAPHRRDMTSNASVRSAQRLVEGLSALRARHSSCRTVRPNSGSGTLTCALLLPC